MKYKLALLKSHEADDHLQWISSLDNHLDILEYDVIEFTQSNWLENIKSKEYDLFICRPPGRNANFKQLYDERAFILNNIINKKIYPSLNEILIYENKRFLSDFLNANEIPHPKTYVFYNKKEALNFSAKTSFPLVGKLNIGAGGSGVKIMNTKDELDSYIKKIFGSKGMKRKWYPNLRKGNFLRRLINRLSNLSETKEYFDKKRQSSIDDTQKDFVLLQEYIKNTIEWRVVRIDNSFFAHKKIAAKGDIKSGTSKVEWGKPPIELLDFTKNITDKHNLKSLALDIFEDTNGIFYVNELQCYFGSKNPHQMIIDNKPVRYKYENEWVLEEGAFNTNNSHDLRLQHILNTLKKEEN